MREASLSPTSDSSSERKAASEESLDLRLSSRNVPRQSAAVSPRGSVNLAGLAAYTGSDRRHESDRSGAQRFALTRLDGSAGSGEDGSMTS